MSLFGPSRVFNYPNSLTLIVSGLVLKGLCDGIIFSLIVPEIVLTLSKKYKGSYNTGRIADTATGLFGLSLELAMMTGQLVGPILCD